MAELVVIRGPIGVGKSTTVDELVRLRDDFSHADLDGMKLMIDSRVSSEWRREVALK